MSVPAVPSSVDQGAAPSDSVCAKCGQLFRALSGPEGRAFLLLLGGFLVVWFLPVESVRFQGAVQESFHLTRWYAREHVLLCLVPAFFIAGAIGAFVSQASVMKYLGAGANKVLAYGVASVSGTILAVCSCTVLPLFAGIWKRGAGLGPAIAFLYAGPAINALAIILTARVLGMEIGIARAVGAVLFSVLIGAIMALMFRGEELKKATAQAAMPAPPVARPLWQVSIHMGSLVGILVFANWGGSDVGAGFFHTVWLVKWPLTALCGAVLAVGLWRWFGAPAWKLVLGLAVVAVLSIAVPGQPQVAFLAGMVALAWVAGTGNEEMVDWLGQSWGFAKQIMPLLLVGVLASGFLLGRPGHEGIIPSTWVEKAVGGNSLGANLFASVSGALMYFATLTEVPILQGLLGSGMGKGPALALLLAGPALSLPSMIVIRGVLGTRKTLVYIVLVVCMATLTGLIYGSVF